MEFISVGTAEKRLPPDLATVHLRVSYTGSDKQEVLAATHERARWLLDKLDTVPGDVLIESSTDGVQSFSHPVWEGDLQGRTVHEASCAIRATFADFSVLGQRVAGWAQADGVSVGHVNWRLTDEHWDAVQSELISEALSDAERRARAIADHFGATDLRVVRVRAGEGGGMVPLAARTAEFGAAAVEARPEDVVVRHAVTVTFEADPRL